MLSMPLPVRAVAYSPGSIGNIGPGLDILGCAVDGAGDTVSAEFVERPGITILEAGDPQLPSDPLRHASGIAAAAVLARVAREGLAAPGGIGLRVTKGLSLSAGQGGSAASAVAGASAANALLGSPLGRDALLAAALASEEQVAGRHLDNIAPSLMGGIVLVRTLDPIDVLAIPVPAALHLVLATPAQRLRTADARAALPAHVSRAVALHQAAHVAGMVAALCAGDLAFLGRSLDDRIAEPARAALLPGFEDAKRAAIDAGALGASISGAGPTSFALCDNGTTADAVAAAMRGAYERAGLTCVARVALPDMAGTRIEVTASP
jgi:homoserine kinase